MWKKQGLQKNYFPLYILSFDQIEEAFILIDFLGTVSFSESVMKVRSEFYVFLVIIYKCALIE